GPRGTLAAVVAGFSGPLNPTTAANPAAYRLVSAGRDRRLGTRDDQTIRLRSARYDAATGAVILTPAGKAPSGQLLRLTISGLSDTAGRSVAGSATLALK